MKRFGFSAETFGMAHKILSTCPEKKLWKKTVFLFSLQNLFEFWAKIFQTFGPKTSKSFQNYLLRVQRNSLWLEIFFLKFWIVLDFLQKHLAWFSKFCLRVQSKNCGKNRFLLFYFQNFFEFWAKYFQNFGQKTSKICEN